MSVSGQVSRELVEDRQRVDNGGHPWFAVRVRSNHEKVAAEFLRLRGYEEFCPLYKAESRWSDRIKIVDRSLFPGYVFTRLDPEDRLPVLMAPGVVGMVGFGKGPCPIPDHEVENVRRMVQSGLLVTPWPYLSEGQLVLLERGPLTGMEGIVKEVKGTLRIVVSVSLLQRSVSAEIERSWVRPLKESKSRTRLTHGPWVQTRAAL
jgi:transcription antitermination factor NusG